MESVNTQEGYLAGEQWLWEKLGKRCMVCEYSPSTVVVRRDYPFHLTRQVAVVCQGCADYLRQRQGYYKMERP